MEDSFNLENNFINNYRQNSSLDFSSIENDLNKIINSYEGRNTLNQKIVFTEEDSIDSPIQITDSLININKTRIRTIHRLDIDSNSIFFSDWIWGFYKNEKTRTSRPKEERLLTDYIDKAKAKNSLPKLTKLGSVRTTEFELLDFTYFGHKTILHNTKKEDFKKETIREASKRDIQSIFEIMYDLLFEKFKSEKTQQRDISPAILNAKHYSITRLEELRKTNYLYDTNLSLHLVNTSPLSKNASSEKISNDIWNSYMKLYNIITANNHSEVFTHFHLLISKSKNAIIDKLKRQADDILKITTLARKRLISLNNPYLTFN